MQTKQQLNILRSRCKSRSSQSSLKRGKVLTCLIGIILMLMPGKGIAQNVNIPDAAFKAALLGNSSINTINDGQISVAEAAAFTGEISVFILGISDLTGIEAFTALTYLNCSSNSLTSLNVSGCTALTYLYCSNNSLTSLNVSGCTALTALECGGNSLTSLDVSANTVLSDFRCADNSLTSLDVSANTALNYLGFNANNLTTIDVSANTALSYLSCYQNSLTSLNVSANTALTYLECDSNSLTSLNVSANTALTYLNCSRNSLTSLNVQNGNNANLIMFAGGNTNLTCIQVDNVANANGYAGVSFFKDAGAGYSTNCIAISWYLDADNDGYYVSTTQSVNSPGAGYTSTLPANGLGDCNDNDVNAHALPTASSISAVGATTFCSGGSVTLTGNNGGVWSTGATSPTISVTTSGTYSVTTTNSCGSTISNSIVVTVNTCTVVVPTTQLRSCDCAKINLTLNAQVACVAVAGATNYEFQFSNVTTNAIYATKVMSGTFIAANNVVPNLQWNTQYYVRVRAKVGGVWGEYGSQCTIGLIQNPAVVGVPNTSLKSTSCNQLNLLPTATIACQQISMSAGYEFEFTDLLTNAVTTKVSSLTYLPLATVSPTLIPMHTYSVRVRAKQYTTWGSYSQACSIRILGATAARTAMNTDQEKVDAMVSEMEEERMNTDMPMDILLYPNPMMDEATVVISSSQNEKVTIAITDITGKVVSNDIFNTNSTFSIQNSELRSGIYFLTATTTGGERKTIKVVKQ